MISNPIIINKITKTFELVCPMFKEKLITEAYIIGSVARGTAKEDSDIDIYLINPDFKKQKNSQNIQLVPEILLENEEEENIYTNKIIELLKVLDTEFKYLESKHFDLETKYLWYSIYKNEKFHFMYDYDSEFIKDGSFYSDYIKITEELCNEINN